MDKRLKQGEKAIDRILSARERQILQAYKASLKEVRASLALLYEKHAKDGVLTMADASKYGRLAELEKSIAKNISAVTGQAIDITKDALKDLYSESYYRAGWAAEMDVSARLGFGEIPKKQVEGIIDNKMDRIGWPDRSRESARMGTRQIREEITRGIIGGKAYDDVARAVSERVNMTVERAIRIIRTEGHRARVQGTLDSLDHAESVGVEMERVWSSALDDRTRDSHQALDQQVANEDGLFDVGGIMAEGPGLTGIAEEDINCRCNVRARVKDIPDRVRRARLPEEEYQALKEQEAERAAAEGRKPNPVPRSEIIPNMNYNEWKRFKDIA